VLGVLVASTRSRLKRYPKQWEYKLDKNDFENEDDKPENKNNWQ